MSATSERRIDGAGLNYTQRLFDALRAHPGSSVDELHAITGIDPETIRSAMRRFRADRVLVVSRVGRISRYWLLDIATAPADRRGRRRQAAGQVPCSR